MTFGSQLFISSCLSHWKGSQDGQPFPSGKLLAVLTQAQAEARILRTATAPALSADFHWLPAHQFLLPLLI